MKKCVLLSLFLAAFLVFCPGSNNPVYAYDGGAYPGYWFYAPTNFKAEASSDSVKLTWTDASKGETEWQIRRKTDGCTMNCWNTISTVYSETPEGTGQTYSFTDKNVTPSTTYYYMIKSVDCCAQSYDDPEVSVTVPMSFIQVQPFFPAPSNLTATVTSSPSVNLSWKDNSSDETGFKIYRKQSGSYQQIGTAAANATGYTDASITGYGTFYYRVCAYNSTADSSYSNEASAWVPLATGTILPTPPAGSPIAPSDLKATAISESEANLTWKDNSNNEDSFEIERASGSGSYAKIGSSGANVATFWDHGLTPGTTYNYRVCAVNGNGQSSYASTAITLQVQGSAGPMPPSGPISPGGAATTIQLQIGSMHYTVNGTEDEMDAAPVSINGRTMLPIKYVAEPLGASLAWNGAEQKATVTLGSKIIELWVGNNHAVVDGVEKQIDAANPDVVPMVLPPGRTMLPLRFVAEALGCNVNWDGLTRTVTVTSPS